MQPFVVDTFKNCEGLGRVAIMEGASVIMLGKVTAVDFKEKAKEPEKAAPTAGKPGDKAATKPAGNKPAGGGTKPAGGKAAPKK